jgi:hypothetical protein
MADFTQSKYDSTYMTQNKRVFHDKESKFRAQVCVFNHIPVFLSDSFQPSQLAVAKSECLVTIVRSDLFRSSLVEVLRQPASVLHGKLAVRFEGEGVIVSMLVLICKRFIFFDRL